MSGIIGTPVQFNSFTGFLTPEAQTKGSYLVDWKMSRFIHNTGNMALPNTASGMSIVNVAAPHGYLFVWWEKVRLNSPPIYPIAKSTDSNKVLLSDVVELDDPGVMADMTGRIWAARGLYVYALLKPYEIGTDDLPTGLLACEQPTSIAAYASQTPPQKASLIQSTLTTALPAVLVLPAVNAKQLF